MARRKPGEHTKSNPRLGTVAPPGGRKVRRLPALSPRRSRTRRGQLSSNRTETCLGEVAHRGAHPGRRVREGVIGCGCHQWLAAAHMAWPITCPATLAASLQSSSRQPDVNGKGLNQFAGGWEVILTRGRQDRGATTELPGQKHQHETDSRHASQLAGDGHRRAPACRCRRAVGRLSRPDVDAC